MHETATSSNTSQHTVPISFETRSVLAALIQLNHIASLYSGASLICRLGVTSIPLGMAQDKVDWIAHILCISTGQE